MRRKTKVEGNVKVRNATKVELDGIKFDSKLEVYTYKALKLNNIPFEYTPTSFTLIPSFKYNGENIRPMTYKPDFVGNDFIIECKGFANDAFPLRWKLFKYVLQQNNQQKDLYLVHNQREVNEMIEKIKSKL